MLSELCTTQATEGASLESLVTSWLSSGPARGLHEAGASVVALGGLCSFEDEPERVFQLDSLPGNTTGLSGRSIMILSLGSRSKSTDWGSLNTRAPVQTQLQDVQFPL